MRGAGTTTDLEKPIVSPVTAGTAQSTLLTSLPSGNMIPYVNYGLKECDQQEYIEKDKRI